MARITQAQREVVRGKLLAAAATHFAEHGFAQANINKISLAAGFAKGTVYNYFPSKDELFAAVLSVGSEETVRRFEAKRETVEPGLRSQLCLLVAEDVALARKHSAFTRVIVREMLCGSAKTRGPLFQGLQPFQALLSQLLDNGRRQGQLGSPLATPRLVQLFGMQMAALYLAHWDMGGWPTWDAFPEVLVGQFLDGAG